MDAGRAAQGAAEPSLRFRPKILLATFRLPVRLTCLAMFLLAALIWLVLPLPSVRRVGLEALLHATGTKVVVHGVPVLRPGVLYVANHVSWLDIVILARLLDAGFVAKSEVAAWPLLGTLARRAGCQFVAREQARLAGLQAMTLASVLASGRSFVLFPEGTTGLGPAPLPFKTSLFPADGLRLVQPITIDYRAAAGALSASARRRIAWIDDDALLPHLGGLLLRGGCRAHVWFEETAVAHDRKQAAAHCESAIAARLGTL